MIYQIQFEDGENIFAPHSDDIQVGIGDYVVFKLNKGEEIGKVTKILQLGNPSVSILRKATQEDIEAYKEIIAEEYGALELCRQKAKEMELPIKIAYTHIQFDKSILRIDYLSEKKIGLRRLMKEIAKFYKERIEFRQIGVRSYAKKFNGIGVCGNILCCRLFMSEFEPITVDLIKLQSLSCGASKLTGFCGKLMCCLAFEKENYTEYKTQKPE